MPSQHTDLTTDMNDNDYYNIIDRATNIVTTPTASLAGWYNSLVGRRCGNCKAIAHSIIINIK